MRNFKRIISVVLSVALLAGCSTSTGTTTGSNYDQNVDYLVIGAGVAGLSSAIEAADIGIENILILEKTGRIGGSAFYSDGILSGYDTQVSNAADVNVSYEEIYAEQMAEKKYILDEELTEFTIKQSGKTIDWLIDNLGMQFEKEIIVKDGYGTLQTVHTVAEKGPGMEKYYQNALDERSQIELRLNTSATELIVENGKVVGAIAVDAEGNKTKISAKAVLIATGGFSANKELFPMGNSAYSAFQTTNFANQSGDGLIMAANIGAAYQNLDQLQVYLREYNNPTSQYPYMFTLFVGQDGKRFMDEKRTAQTYNQEIKDDVIDLYGRTGVDYFWSIADEASLTSMGIAEQAKDHNGIVYADTLEELAEKMGVDATAFVETINKWNSACATAKDTEYGRTSPMWFPVSTGPYYALQTTFFSSVTHGGLVKNENAQVLKIDGTPIDGLFAAGEVTTVTNSNGYTISNAITFGRVAAQSALKYINGETLVSEDKNNSVDKPTEKEELFDMSQTLTDGEYEASVDGQNGKLTVKTTIKDGVIANVEVLSHNETDGIADEALEKVPAMIVSENSLEIDAVSGATLTTQRIQKAVENTLQQAVN